MPKDRHWRRYPARYVQIITERSSTHPVRYAITLAVERGGAWHIVCVFDNAHNAEEHHEHRYVGAEKQPPLVTRGPVNEAMHRAEIKLLADWFDIVRSWEATR